MTAPYYFLDPSYTPDGKPAAIRPCGNLKSAILPDTALLVCEYAREVEDVDVEIDYTDFVKVSDGQGSWVDAIVTNDPDPLLVLDPEDNQILASTTNIAEAIMARECLLNKDGSIFCKGVMYTSNQEQDRYNAIEKNTDGSPEMTVAFMMGSPFFRTAMPEDELFRFNEAINNIDKFNAAYTVGSKLQDLFVNEQRTPVAVATTDTDDEFSVTVYDNRYLGKFTDELGRDIGVAINEYGMLSYNMNSFDTIPTAIDCVPLTEEGELLNTFGFVPDVHALSIAEEAHALGHYSVEDFAQLKDDYQGDDPEDLAELLSEAGIQVNM